MMVVAASAAVVPSLPSRGAWIEILRYKARRENYTVAPLAGSVDRNNDGLYQYPTPDLVAPLAGSVDRNHHGRDLLRNDRRRSPRGERG